MTDRELTEALALLGLDRANHRAIGLLPLIEVAWADGRVQRAERDLIVKTAARYGIEPGDAWLDRWLKRRPPATTFLTARTVLLALMARAGRSEWSAPETLEALLDLCTDVAAAAGGLFGLAFTIERSERACMEEIATSLALGPALPKEVARSWDTAGRAAGFSDAPTRLLRKPTAPVPSAASTDDTVPRAPRPALDDEPTAKRLVRPPSTDPERFQEEDPTVPFFDGLGGIAYVDDDDDEDD